MSIRITGMYSGLDTESIINELASAQSYKVTSLVKAQTRLSWKQDAWKALNTKIYNFYTNVLSDMRYESSYLKKKTTVSDTSAISIVSGDDAVNGVNTVKVEQLAKAAYLTGGSIQTASGVCFTSGATLSQLGFTGEGSITVAGANGASFDIDLTGDMTISDVVSKLQATGLNASFDQTNQRLFVSSSNTGAINDFTITANNTDGISALAALGLLSTNDLASDEYVTWASYGDTDDEEAQAAYQAALDAEVAERAAAYKAANDALEEENAAIAANNETNWTNLKNLEGYSDDEDLDSLKLSLYGITEEVTTTDEDGNEVTETVTTYEEGSYGKALADAQDALTAAQEALAAAQEEGSEATEEGIAELKAAVESAQAAGASAQEDFDAAETRYSYLSAIAANEATIAANEATIEFNSQYFEEDEDGNITGTEALEEAVDAEFQEKIAAAQAVVNGDYDSLATATKIDGQDAVITLNGAEFTSRTNTFTVNGLTFTALKETDSEVTMTTAEDTDGIYDMIKNFFTEYNALINEMDALYNAESASDYDVLTSEEKDAMSDSEIEEWEQKIKDSLLRRDSTLSTVASAMKSIMLQGATVNGTQMYLSDFGISTLGYFSAAENERNAYHIDGDSDDANSTVSQADDVLKSMIASDPDTVTEFFTTLSKNLYESLTNQMSSTTMSSAFTVYNDKQLQDEYDDYTDKISEQEEKLNDLIDKWYTKFSAMETALAKLESQSSSLSSLLGS